MIVVFRGVKTFQGGGVYPVLPEYRIWDAASCFEWPLLTAEEVGKILRVPAKSVYELPIPRVRLGVRRLRWRPHDVDEFITGRIEIL